MTDATLVPRRSRVALPVHSASHRQSIVNGALGWALIVFVALVPVPFGSARPIFWTINAGVVGLMGIACTLALGRLDEPFRYGLGRMPMATVLFVLLALWLVVQTLPIGQLGIPAIGQLLAFDTAAGATMSAPAISLAPGATWLMLLRWMTFGVFFLLVLQAAGSERRAWLMLQSAAVIIAFYAVLSIATLTQLGDTILGLEKWAYQGSATATFVNRNSFATFLAFGAVVCCALLAGTLVRTLPADREQRARSRFDLSMLLYAGALVAIAAALLATQSRMGTFSAAAGCLVVAAAALLRLPRPWLKVLLLLPVLVALACLGFLAYGQNLIDRLGTTAVNADVRLALYTQVLQMIAARPWTGFGGGSFELAFPLFHQLPVSPDLLWEKAHNSYLTLWAELGLVAGSIPILLGILALSRCLGGLGAARRSWAARTAGAGCLIAAGLHSLVDFSLEIEADALMLLFIVGIASAAALRTRDAPN
jgi:O-antigen ligase